MEQVWTVVSRKKGAGKQGKPRAGIAPPGAKACLQRDITTVWKDSASINIVITFCQRGAVHEGSADAQQPSSTSATDSKAPAAEHSAAAADNESNSTTCTPQNIAPASIVRLPKRNSRRERTPEEKARDLQGHISLAKEEILKSDFFRELHRRMQQAEEDALEAADDAGANDLKSATWDSIEAVVVYGLGSLEASPVSRYQLALALLLAEGFAGLKKPVEAYDPVFTQLDKQVLSDAGCKVVETDEQGARSASSPTLFFLPHCAASFSHNLLVANWKPERLQNLAIIGNSLLGFTGRWDGFSASQREGRTEPTAVLEVCRSRSVVDVGVKECDFPIRGAFNDLSVHLFPGFPASKSDMQKLDLSHLKRNPADS